MKTLLLFFLALAAALAQTAPGISTGREVPQTGLCGPLQVANIYIRSQDPSNGPSQAYRCTQTGALTYAWQPLDHLLVAANPSKCAVGDLSYQTGATAGFYGCTATDTWRLLVQLNGSGQLPAVSGALLTNLPGALSIGGSDGQVQWNNSGVLGGDSGLAYNSSTKALGVIGGVVVGQSGTATGSVTFNGTTSGSLVLKSADIATNSTVTLPGVTGTLAVGPGTFVSSSDPGCTTTAHVGKFWFDTTTTTTAIKVCVNVTGSVGWSVITATP